MADPATMNPVTSPTSPTSPTCDDDQRYRLRSVDRALDALELLAGAGQGGLTLTELADRLAVAKSSAFALLHTLVARGYAAEAGGRLDRTYRLGMALARLGDAAERQSPLISLALPVLQSITDSTGLTSRLVVPDGPYAVAVARVDGPGSRATSAPGSTLTAPRRARRCWRRCRGTAPARSRSRRACRCARRARSPTRTRSLATWR
jgi:hypothetical protein